MRLKFNFVVVHIDIKHFLFGIKMHKNSRKFVTVLLRLRI